MESKKTIMLVDDNPDIVAIVKGLLEREGFNVVTASSGYQLFTLLEERRPDVILLDLMMPEMDGFEVLTRLKDTPGTSSIPVILLTARNKHTDMLEGYRLGAAYYIPKPFIKTQVINGVKLFFKPQALQRWDSTPM